MALRSSSVNSGTSPTPAVGVPTGASTGDHVILTFEGHYNDYTSPTVEAGDLPAGVVTLDQGPCSADATWAWVGYKILTGNDTGSYTLGVINDSTSRDWVMHAYCFSGRHASTVPVVSARATQNTLQSSPVTVTANGVTAVAGDDLLMISAPDVNTSGGGAGHTAPTSPGTWVERRDTEFLAANMGGFTSENVSGGATGPVAAVFSTSSGTAGYIAWVVRVPAAVTNTLLLPAVGSLSFVGRVLALLQEVANDAGIVIRRS